MGVSRYVVGLLSDTRADVLFKIYNLCMATGVVPPHEAVVLFEDEDQYFEGLGRYVDIDAEEGTGDMIDWIVVDIAQLPEGVTAVAFITSY